MMNTGKWVDNQLMIKDNTYNNESILQNMIKDFEINEHGSIFKEKILKSNKISGFCFEK